MARQEPKMRVMKRDDIDAVVAIDTLVSKQQRREYYLRKIESVVSNPHNINTSLVAELDGKIVGFIMGDVYFGEFGIPETSATIDTIGVHPDHRRRGIGAHLLAECEAKLEEPRLKLTVRAGNEPALALYERFGYAEIERWPGYYSDGETGIVMEKLRAG